MQFDHEKLDVYQLALEFLAFAQRLSGDLPRGESHIADQLRRAASSVVLNIAEGTGKISRADKRRYYLIARGSATECASLMDVLLHTGHLLGESHQESKAKLVRVVAMLVRLAQSMERRGA